MIAYFVTTEDGSRVRDKDGVEYVEWGGITPFNFELFAYRNRQAAEGAVKWRDPDGKMGLQVAERQINFEINNT